MVTFKEIYEQLEEAAPVSQGDPSGFKVKASELFSRCRAASTAMHFFHLITPSYASHMASQQFYEEIIPLVDSFAESFIGRYGKFETFPNVRENATDVLTIVGNLTKWIDSNREMISDLSEIQNSIDEILSLCNSTAYKLRELK